MDAAVRHYQIQLIRMINGAELGILTPGPKVGRKQTNRQPNRQTDRQTLLNMYWCPPLMHKLFERDTPLHTMSQGHKMICLSH